jgi:type III secretion protein U
MSEEKTEKPTRKRLRDARKDGEVSKSADLADAVSMLAVIVVLVLAAGMFADAMHVIVTVALGYVSTGREMPDLYARMFKMGGEALLVAVPCVLVAALGGVAALVPQVGLSIAMKPVVPDLGHASPVAGIKRLFTWRTLIELAKMLVKALLVGTVMWFTVKWMLPLIVGSLYQSLSGLASMFWSLTVKLCAIAAVVFVVIGAIDARLQQTMFLRKMRMSKDEIKRERKQQEGDPKIKGERKRLARELVNSATPRMRVGLANALIVNPTHYAVAIRYAPSEHPLPLVTAKGMDEAAAELRRYAQETDVPIIGNPPVARALYKIAIDEPVPEELFETVAAILRWVEAVGARRGATTAS